MIQASDPFRLWVKLQPSQSKMQEVSKEMKFFYKFLQP